MNNIMNNTLIISIEGNIGSGKSSIMKFLSIHLNSYIKKNGKSLNICYLQEPVEIWNTFTDKNNENIIQKYYQDQKKYAFQFQMMAYISRLSQFKDALSKNYDVIFTERSILTDKNVFAKMLYDSEKIEEIEYKIYNKWFYEFSNYIDNIKIYYIKTNPNICFDRIIKRNRKGEEEIPLDYLNSCHDYHEKWLNQYKNIFIHDGNIDINYNDQSDLLGQDDIFNNILNNVYNNIINN